MNYKNSNTGEVISKDCYNKLPNEKKKQYSSTFHSVTHRVNEDESSGDFLTSLLVAEVTGNAMLGAAVGGDLLGGIIGAEINEELSTSDDNTSIDTPDTDTSGSDMGGGDFGGGGGGGDW